MSFFRFWNSDPDVFAELVSPLSTYRRPPLKLPRIYVSRSGRIYLDNMRDTKTFFHKASHHVITLYMPSLYKTARGRAVEETVADIAAIATKSGQCPETLGGYLSKWDYA
jgi:hypothetical protein